MVELDLTNPGVYNNIVIGLGQVFELQVARGISDVPKVQVVFYKETSEEVAVLDWLDEIEKKHASSSTKIRTCIQRLATEGHQLRRPTADYLRDNVYELRANYQGRAYRLLYFFHKERVVLCLGLLKRDDHRREFDKAIDKTIKKRSFYIQNPDKYTYEGGNFKKFSGDVARNENC